ncbi:hypothetical protein CIB95_06515 [Lottiidibacillus patelloidae]|uniref:Uncharacterized protein n=1 Tax=Lottiidibacillus patelloidae TaxID=2670334 RepID=A0A263BU80_9BACI|nr:hypothetical protein [Lottiidibacillus patelloidae]OZM57118.1 hypothetical protein CIB95_06515 [Lottiidibacillus patelloidae]
MSKEMEPQNFESSSSTPNPFCIPEEKFPELSEREMLTSPTSCLEHDDLEILEKHIKKANELLLDLATTGDHGRETVIVDSAVEKAFKRLLGIKVTVKTVWPINILFPVKIPWMKRVTGEIEMVGMDFVAIKSFYGERFLPFHSICLITHEENDFVEKEKNTIFDNLEPCDRRNLVLKFGKSVANSPTLFKHFFSPSIKDILKKQIGLPIIIRTTKKRYTGTIKDVTERKVLLDTKNGEVGITFAEISIFALPTEEK